MAHYKIKNITNTLGKRHVSKDSVLNIEYHVGFQKKFSKLGVNDEALITCRTLPVSVQLLRAKKLITISEISENEFVRLQKPSARKKPIKINQPKVVNVEKKEVVKEKPKKNRTYKKKTTTTKAPSETSTDE